MADAQSAEVVWEMVQSGDHGWVLSRSMAILSMQGGFALLEAGTVRAKNTKNILLKNLLDACVGALIWYSVGFMIAVCRPRACLYARPKRGPSRPCCGCARHAV